MGKQTSSVFVELLAGIFCIGATTAAVAGHTNPVDRISNPKGLDYTDVEVSPRHLKEPFVRDGIVTEPARFANIKPGLTQADVRSRLGEPIQQRSSSKQAWDYNFQMKLPQSENFMVCQYKVVFDRDLLVRDTVWRRRQCQQLAGQPD